MSGAPFEDSRRLTGANLYVDGTGSALETAPGLAFDAGTLQRWRANIARVRAALRWPDGAVVVREHATGASLAAFACNGPQCSGLPPAGHRHDLGLGFQLVQHRKG